MDYLNTPWDLKLFYKWIKGKPLFVIAHSDDFRWFGSEDVLHEWDALVKNFNAHKYTVTDCTDKEFVGINITRDADFNYYMEKLRFHFLYNVSYSRLSMVYFECKFLYMTVELFPSIFMFLFESSILYF